MSKEEAIDVEKGNADAVLAPPPPLYPKMTEDPRARWSFIRKVYSILAAQFVFTSAVGAVGAFIRPIPRFFLSRTPASLGVFLVILIIPFIALVPMMIYRHKHPLNIIFLSIFTACISCSVMVTCAIVNAKVILEAAILTGTMFIGLTLFTFWAARKGRDFTFLFPFLFASLHVLLIYILIQIFFPLGKVAHTVYSFVATIVFTGFIIFDTQQLIKRHNYDQYIDAAISLYLDIVNLFMSLIGLTGIAH
ncbi:hypothetical protein J5N97_016055 [Dioscorea zingiberensis]|uniref:BI1-like protein n=1 Tax=Dioscorea zingiberensis TaxID=325984 RepID=A0A9D5CJ98_9LILI|nr:hypothetical protein J5N97_016055 [Dioscorea zingiberensis]